MAGKEDLQTLLDGGIPATPPTWELVFQIQKEFFGMDRDLVKDAVYGSEADKEKALWQFDFDVYERCVEELGWAAIPGSYNPEELAFRKEKIGDRALVTGFEGGGVFSMPDGNSMMDFSIRCIRNCFGVEICSHAFERPFHAEMVLAGGLGCKNCVLCDAG